MTGLGLCISPRIYPDARALAELNPPFLRSILYRDDDLDLLLAMGLPLWLTINNEWGRLAGWDIQSACRFLAAKQTADRRIWRVSLGNEFDAFWQSNPSDVPPSFAAGLVNASGPTLRGAGAEVWSTSVVSGRWPEYLDGLVAACRDNLDGIDLHAYGQRPEGWGRPGWMFGDLKPMLEGVRATYGKAIGMSEYGCKVRDAGGEEQQAAWIEAAAKTCADLDVDAAYFSYHDLLGKPGEQWDDGHGLLRPDGSKRPAYAAYAALAGARPAPVPEPVPAPEPIPMPDYRAMTREAAVNAGIDPDLFERQIALESDGYSIDVIECRRASSAGAQGIAQIVARFHPGVNPCDPPAALAYAAGLMRNNLAVRNGDWALALSMYNAGPGATAGGLAGTLAGWPYAETVRYVAAILRIGEAEARRRLTGQGGQTVKLSEVLARGRSRIGDPYVWGGKVPPRTDCSGFAAWCYQGKITSFTDAVLGETERVEKPAPGDVVLYEYDDPGQPNVRFPHMGLFISDATVLDNRFPQGVGEHPQLARSFARRYYRRLAGVTVDTVGLPPAPPAPAPAYSVGPGILEAMAAHDDQPATDEVYQGATAWSEAYGRSGARYVYVKSLNRTFRFDPAA